MLLAREDASLELVRILMSRIAFLNAAFQNTKSDAYRVSPATVSKSGPHRVGMSAYKTVKLMEHGSREYFGNRLAVILEAFRKAIFLWIFYREDAAVILLSDLINGLYILIKGPLIRH